MSRFARVLFVLLLLMEIGQAVSLYNRARYGATDFSVFYRTCRLLKTGIGADLYPRNDPVAKFPIALSPTGLAILQPLTVVSVGAAGAVWAILNLIFVAIALFALRSFLDAVGNPRLAAAFPWAACIFLILAAGSIQVGQFSVLIVTCWMLWLVTLHTSTRDFRSGFLVALPTTIKLYPGLLLAAPLSTDRTWSRVLRHILFAALGLFIAGLLIPVVAYGSRAWALDVSFLRNTVFNLSPLGPVGWALLLQTNSNQSLPTVLLRYFTYAPAFHDRFAYLPHLNLARDAVIHAVAALDVLILLVTVVAVLRWRHRQTHSGARELMMAAALWSATLYLLLPDAKWRYAVYTLPAFLPLLENAARDCTRWARVARVTEILACLFLVVAEMPDSWQAFGLGLLGAIFLWIENLRLLAHRNTHSAAV